jgi:4-hydroxyproline epimerase
MAQLFAKGKLKMGEPFVHESFIGSKFVGKVEQESTLAGKQAIVPSIQGWAQVTGYNNIIIDDDDPYAHGFQVI